MNKWVFRVGGLLLVLVFTILTGCNNEDEVIGRYDVSEIYGTDISVDDYDYYFIELNEDGTFTEKGRSIYSGTIFSQSGTYEVDDDVITFTMNTDEGIKQTKCKLKDGKIEVKLPNTDITLYFKKND